MSTDPPGSKRAPVLDAAAFATLLPILAAAVRVWLFSGGDPTIFRTLIRTLDIPAPLIATGIQMAPVAMVILVITLLTDWRFRDKFGEWADRNPWLRFVLLPLLVVITLTVPILYVLATLAALAVPPIIFAAIRRHWGWGKKNIADILVAPRGDKNGPNSWSTVTVVGITVLMSGVGMWLPLEMVTAGESGDREYIGYVLESDEAWTTVLTEGKSVVTLQTDKIDSRTYCSDDGLPRIADALAPERQSDRVDCTAETRSPKVSPAP